MTARRPVPPRAQRVPDLARPGAVFLLAAALLALHGLLAAALAVGWRDMEGLRTIGLAAPLFLALSALLWTLHPAAWAAGVACLGLAGGAWLALGAGLVALLSDTWASGPGSPLGYTLRGLALGQAPVALIAGALTCWAAVALWRARDRLRGAGGHAAPSGPVVAAVAASALLAWIGFDAIATLRGG